MKTDNKNPGFRFPRWLMIVTGILILALTGIYLILPWWAVRYVEKHDREWINRDITIEQLRLNPFTLGVTAGGVRITEPESDSTFVKWNRAYVNLALWPLFKSNAFIEALTVDDFYGHVIHAGSAFNFDDLLESEGTETEATDGNAGWAYQLNNIAFQRAQIIYDDVVIGSRIALDSIGILVDAFGSADTVFRADFRAQQPAGGSLDGQIRYNLQTKDYQTSTSIKTLALEPFKPYVTRGMRLGDFRGHFNADFHLSGNAGASDFLACSGAFEVGDFRMTDPEQDTLVLAGKLELGVDSIDTHQQLYDFRKLQLSDTYAKFEYLANGDNFSNLLVYRPADTLSAENAAADTAEVEINTRNYYASPFEYLALYIYDLTKDYIFNAYEIDTMAVRNFNLRFYDYTLEDPFYFDLSSTGITAGEIELEDEEAEFAFAGVVNRTGSIDGKVHVSREGVRNMDVDFQIKGVFLTRFSPYSRFYTAHPFWEGAVTFTSTSSIKDYYLKSDNHLFIEQIEVGDKNKTGSGNSLPMKLAVALIRDVDGNVDLDIPIEGQLDDPGYKLGKIIWQVIKNIVVKAASAPFRLLADAFNVDEDDLKTVYFDSGQTELGKRQTKALNSISQVLSKKPEITVAFFHLYNREYELDALAIRKAKADYLAAGAAAEMPEDSMDQAGPVATTDSLFRIFLAETSPAFDSTISIAENARRRYGEENLQNELNTIIATQQRLITEYLTAGKGIPAERFTIKDLSTEEISLNQTHPKFTVEFGVDGEETEEEKEATMERDDGG